MDSQNQCDNSSDRGFTLNAIFANSLIVLYIALQYLLR